MAATVVPAAATLLAPVVDHALQKIRSIVENPNTSFDDRHKALKYGLEWLLALRRDKENEVRRNIIQKDPSEVYKHWEVRVSNIEKEVPSLNTKYEEVKSTWNLLEIGHLENEINKVLNDVIALLEECPEKILVDKLPERVKEEPGVPSIEKYSTLKNAFDDIQALLKTNGVKCVALRGQKGVGKTTIMQNLNNHHFNDDSANKEYDMVIFIKVAADEQTDLSILQKIADRMRVDKEGDEVATRIQRVLKDKRYLLILDGINHTIDGIWRNLDISKDVKDSKVVITTSHCLAWKSACVQMVVELKTLSHTEEWQMFRDIVGPNLLHDIPNPRLVCKRFCCCFPLLIHHIAMSLKFHQAPIDWDRALQECTPWPQVAKPQSDLEELSSYLEFCFETLDDQNEQKCFLFASLYPANSNICTHYLVECFIVHGFLDEPGADTSYSGMRKRAINCILKHLVNAAFLEEGEHMRYVKMNDLNRQLALYISSKYPELECRTYVDDNNHTESHRSDSWRLSRWVSMVGSERHRLPEIQNCESLQTVLLLQKNMKLVKIPSNYFQSMSKLIVLDLYGAEISELPSLAGLTGLKAFYLNGCSKLKIGSPNIQSLEHLEVFDIRGIEVDFVPCLESLRCLKISCIRGNIYQGISKLPKLEELTIEGCNDNTSPENAIEELTIEGCNDNTSPENDITVFKGALDRGSLPSLHTLTLKNTSTVFNMAADHFPELQNLVVQDCSRIEVLIKVTEGKESIVSKLKMLTLDNLSHIKSLCSDENLAWSSLEEFHVRKCPELKELRFNNTFATLHTIKGEEEWWSNLMWTSHEAHEQLKSAFSAST